MHTCIKQQQHLLGQFTLKFAAIFFCQGYSSHIPYHFCLIIVRFGKYLVGFRGPSCRDFNGKACRCVKILLTVAIKATLSRIYSRLIHQECIANVKILIASCMNALLAVLKRDSNIYTIRFAYVLIGEKKNQFF